MIRKISLTEIALIALVVLFFCLWVKGCSNQNQLLHQISKYELKEKEFSLKMQKDSSTIATQEQTILTQKQAIASGLLDMDKKMKSIESQITAKVNAILTHKQIPFIPKGYVDTTGKNLVDTTGKNLVDTTGWVRDSTGKVIRTDSISVPQAIELKEKWFYIKGTVNKLGVRIDSLNMPNKITATVGREKSGFLNLSSRPVVKLKNENPYMQVQSMDNIIIKNPKKLLQRPLFWGIVGAVGGFILNSRLK